MEQNRRNFLKLTGLGIAAGTVLPFGSGFARAKEVLEQKPLPFSLGLASYTTRKFSLEKTLETAKKLELKYVSFKEYHMPLKSTDDEIKQVVAKVKEAGLELYAGGVIYMKTEDDVNNAFRYAQAAGLKMIIGVPNHELLDLTEKKAKETGILVAIHNHGPGDKLYPTPESIMDKIKTRDKCLGICMDIGHIVRLGMKPEDSLAKCFDRVLDIHVKDEDKTTAEGKPLEAGRGVTDLPRFFKKVIKLKFKGIVAFEYEKDPDDPFLGLAESVGYVRGILRSI